MIKDNKLLENLMKFGIKSTILLKKNLRVNLHAMKNIQQAKIKSYEKKVNASFHNDKMPKEGSHCICLSNILIESVFKIGKSYYPQMLLEKCSYIAKEKKMPKYFTDNVEISSDDSDESNEEQIKIDFFMLVKYQLFIFQAGGKVKKYLLFFKYYSQ